jgi:hypothetical protein
MHRNERAHLEVEMINVTLFIMRKNKMCCVCSFILLDNSILREDTPIRSRAILILTLWIFVALSSVWDYDDSKVKQFIDCWNAGAVTPEELHLKTSKGSVPITTLL